MSLYCVFLCTRSCVSRLFPEQHVCAPVETLTCLLYLCAIYGEDSFVFVCFCVSLYMYLRVYVIVLAGCFRSNVCVCGLVTTLTLLVSVHPTFHAHLCIGSSSF